jgi:ABC-2 type transport system permease protein
MLGSVFAKTLWDQRRALLGWAIGITAVGVLYAAFYPVINVPGTAAFMESFPPAVMDAMGFTDFMSPAGYLGSTTYGLLGPILVVVMGAWAGGAGIAGEEESGRLDLTLAHPVSRWSVLVQRFGVVIAEMLVVMGVLALAVILISGPAELGDIGAANIVAASLHLAGLGIVFGGLALAVGAATGRRSFAYGIVAIVGVAAFFGNNLGPSVEGLAWLRDVSPFHYYSGGAPLKNGLQGGDLAVLLVASAALVGLGGLVFDRRDVAV